MEFASPHHFPASNAKTLDNITRLLFSHARGSVRALGSRVHVAGSGRSRKAGEIARCQGPWQRRRAFDKRSKECGGEEYGKGELVSEMMSKGQRRCTCAKDVAVDDWAMSKRC